ncbi:MULTISPECIES: UDP-2,3-diacylglucosamine diphosphatase [unclassified Shewanella]|uniref:UDP-2,3-diacylglucosamine diphosphatase n=1 Tax=unclassified Shewanella TaxID=196818 RepID=UPI000C835502|nr:MULTISPECIES: UDP-2,3-diacylglucosamine diphosphatase [unclassified Shewanella]MCC4832919.1 UDP-2,3-diacylglucosamine diphosphatase [Shewanella sp. 10N.7]
MSQSHVDNKANFNPFSEAITANGRSLPPENIKQQFNALWLSDIHLGSVDCKAEFLLNLLTQTKAAQIYLVGDVIDIWALKRKVYWPETHNLVLQKLLQLAKDGTQIKYIPGNHDEAFKSYTDFHLWGITMANEYIHECITGEKILMLHGDQFDSEVCVSRAYAKLGDHLYDVLLFLNRKLHQIRHACGFPYWSLASYVKLRVNKAQHAIEMYRDAVLRYAKTQQVQAVVCGHIHQPELSLHDDIIYANDGDWVENCTLIAETFSGQLQLLRWSDEASTTKVIKQFQLNVQPSSEFKQKVA